MFPLALACRYIGVTKVLLYVDDKNPSAETDAIKNYSPKFLRWRTLEDDRRQGEDDSHFVRRRCMKQAADAFAYMVYLNTYDYIMPRGAGKNSRGQLTTLLSINEFRYGPGVILFLLWICFRQPRTSLLACYTSTCYHALCTVPVFLLFTKHGIEISLYNLTSLLRTGAPCRRGVASVRVWKV